MGDDKIGNVVRLGDELTFVVEWDPIEGFGKNGNKFDVDAGRLRLEDCVHEFAGPKDGVVPVLNWLVGDGDKGSLDDVKLDMDVGLFIDGPDARVDVDDNNGVEYNEPELLDEDGKLDTDLDLCRVGVLDKTLVDRSWLDGLTCWNDVDLVKWLDEEPSLAVWELRVPIALRFVNSPKYRQKTSKM